MQRRVNDFLSEHLLNVGIGRPIGQNVLFVPGVDPVSFNVEDDAIRIVRQRHNPGSVAGDSYSRKDATQERA